MIVIVDSGLLLEIGREPGICNDASVSAGIALYIRVSEDH